MSALRSIARGFRAAGMSSLLLLVFVHCGGGDDANQAPPPPPPTTTSPPPPNFGTATLEVYVKASNPGGGLDRPVPGPDPIPDLFGSSVALTGDTLAVGAWGEDSCATGINGDQTNNGCIEAGAVYVFTRSNSVWSQQAYIKASNAFGAPMLAAPIAFGSSVALDDSLLVVGSPGEIGCSTGVNGAQGTNSSTCVGAGAVYTFTHTAGVWTQQAYLKASNTKNPVVAGTGIVGFGNSVALSGNTLAVGASREASCATGINGDQENNGCLDAGAVYVFTQTGGLWSQQAYVKASNTKGGYRFGASVALDEDTLVVGATGESSCADGPNGDQAGVGCVGAGAAYVFTRKNGVWTQEAYVKSSNSEARDGFGISVTVSGDRLTVGAPGEDSCATGINGDDANNGCTDSGAVYVFTRTKALWTQSHYVKPLTTTPASNFGRQLQASGNLLAVSSPGDSSCATRVNGDRSNSGCQDAGAAHIFAGANDTWTEQAYIKASNTEIADGFGGSLASSGNTLAVGTPFEDSSAAGINGDQMNNGSLNSGATYVYVAH
jgi:hypothetical protein